MRRVRALRSEPGADIWFYGGGARFGQLLAPDRVDTVEPAVNPVLPGDGVPFLPAPGVRRLLRMLGCQTWPGGMMVLAYGVVGAANEAQGGPPDSAPEGIVTPPR